MPNAIISPKVAKVSSEGKKVQQNLTLKFVIEMSKEFKFSKSKSIHEAIIECRSYIGRKICQIGKNGLCVSTLTSLKRLLELFYFRLSCNKFSSQNFLDLFHYELPLASLKVVDGTGA